MKALNFQTENKMNRTRNNNSPSQSTILAQCKKAAVKFMDIASNNRDGLFWLPDSKKDHLYDELKLEKSQETISYFKNATPACQATILRQTAAVFLKNEDQARSFRNDNNISNILVATSPTWIGWTGEHESPYLLFVKEGADLTGLIQRGTTLRDPNNNADWTSKKKTSTPQENSFGDEFYEDDGSYATSIRSAAAPSETRHSSADSYESPELETQTRLIDQLTLPRAYKVLAEISSIQDVEEVNKIKANTFAFINAIASNLGMSPYTMMEIPMNNGQNNTEEQA